MKVSARIRSIRAGEEHEVCALIRRSFDKFVGCDYTREGVDEFYQYVNPSAMTNRLSAHHIIFVAEESERIVGMIEFRDGEHISLLFVDPQHLGKGLSRLLFTRALGAARERYPAVREVTVHSSTYAVPVYQSFGFKIAGPEKTVRGIKFVPMTLFLDAAGA